ncbi:PrpF protein [Paramyrothecium foliicola]|nr:PrpF protein [Paramyrothecium foliicola]
MYFLSKKKGDIILFPQRIISARRCGADRQQTKCNNERPQCINCKTYGRECIYEPVSEIAKEAGRERHERFRRHRQFSTRPRARTTGGSTTRSPPSDDGVTATTVTPERSVAANVHDGNMEDDVAQQQQSLANNKPEASVSRILVWANGLSSYHGRTSALFEDNIQERPAVNDPRPRMPDDWVERGLVAEAVRQRQLEDLNFRQGKLDFDGVDPDLGMHLLSLHWNRQHHSFLITYRPAFMRDMACNGPYFSKLLLNAIYFGASKFSPRLEVRKDPSDVRTAGWIYRERVRELLGSSLDRSDITTIQALLQMTNSLFALGDERSAAWLYSGLAFRMLIDLGLHVDARSTRRFSDEDLEIRRRVFWGAFVVDKIQSLYQGRPVSLKDTDALVPIQFLDTYEELEHWQPFAYGSSSTNYHGSPAYSVSTFTSLCKLSITMSDILSCIYTERSSDQSSADLSSTLNKLQRQLDKWREGLPSHLHFDPVKSATTAPPPHVFSLHAIYNVLVILLHRPFVADGHLYSTSRSISVDSFMKCASAASNITNLLRAYHRAFSIRKAPYLISYATYVAATIHTRIAAKRGSGSSAYGNLMTCLSVFQENQETNSAVNKASMIVRGLMKKHGISIEEVPSEALDVLEQSKDLNVDQSQDGAIEETNIEATSEQTGTANKKSGRQLEKAAKSLNSTATEYSPGSDWMDVDGIIQNFLQENTISGARPIATNTATSPSLPGRQTWPAQQQQSSTITVEPQFNPQQPYEQQYITGDMSNTRPVFPEAPWPHEWQAETGESWPLMDPLFGGTSRQDKVALAMEKPAALRTTRRHEMPCVLMRGGTSKGMFLHRKDLPERQEDWAPCLVSAMGSRGNDPRQVDGIGGGTSTTSKVAVVSPSTRPGVDVDFTFVQVSVGKESVDFTGTCGNILSGVGPFAVQEGLVKPNPGQATTDVVVYNTNTGRVVIETMELDEEGQYREDGDFSIPGVKTTGSEVVCTFVDPVGSMTGRLFPSGQRQELLEVASPDNGVFHAKVSLIDSANPFVLIDASSIAGIFENNTSPAAQDALVECIRQHGAVAMGLAHSVEEASRIRGTPKAALLYAPVPSGPHQKPADIRVLAYSMGLPHPSLQLTGAVCLAVALCSPGTVAADISKRNAPPTPERTPSPGDGKPQEVRKVKIAHSQGSMDVSVASDGIGGKVRSCAVSRTARRLFEGKVRYYIDEEL